MQGTASPDTGSYPGVHSPRLKAARRLNKRAFRQRERAFLAEGPQAVAEAFHCGAQVTDLFVTVPARTRHRDLVAAIAATGIPVHVVSGEVMDELAQTVTPQGLLAVCGFVDVPLAEVARAAPGVRTECLLDTRMHLTPAADFLPPYPSLPKLREAAARCRRCDLWINATQTVFGEGPANAEAMLVGEQPGDQEDRVGHPFVGPAGKLLDAGLEQAGIARRRVYLTNAVKHFKFVLIERGRRLHKKPSPAQVRACKPWLMEEIRLVQPKAIVALGATAAQALLGREFRGSRSRRIWPKQSSQRCIHRRYCELQRTLGMKRGVSSSPISGP